MCRVCTRHQAVPTPATGQPVLLSLCTSASTLRKMPTGHRHLLSTRQPLHRLPHLSKSAQRENCYYCHPRRGEVRCIHTSGKWRLVENVDDNPETLGRGGWILKTKQVKRQLQPKTKTPATNEEVEDEDEDEPERKHPRSQLPAIALALTATAPIAAAAAAAVVTAPTAPAAVVTAPTAPASAHIATATPTPITPVVSTTPVAAEVEWHWHNSSDDDDDDQKARKKASREKREQESEQRRK